MAEPASGTNSFDPAVAKQFFGDIRRLEAEMESRKGQHMAWNKRQRELINEVYDRAKDAGIPKRAFKAFVKKHGLQAKADAVYENLEEEDQDHFEMLEDALGDFKDTPLGQAAMANAGNSDDGDEDVRPRHLKQREQDRKDKALDAAAVTH